MTTKKARNIGFLPLRSGSKGIPGKNMMTVAGKPLCFYAIEALVKSRVDEIVISTDSDHYKYVIKKHFEYDGRLSFPDRSEEVSTDLATTESVVLEYLKSLKRPNPFDNIILIQATNPFVTAMDIDAMISMVKGKFQSSMSVVDVSDRFFWAADGDMGDFVCSLSKNVAPVRQPRQLNKRAPLYIENGAIYINTIGNWLDGENRFTSPINVYRMETHTLIEIDSYEDLDSVEPILQRESK